MRRHPGASLFFIIGFLILAGRAWTGPPSLPQTPLPSAYDPALRAFESFIEERMAFDRVPGMSVALFKDGGFWAKGFGYADLENRVPAAAESSYRLASISKTITAVAVLQLAEGGKIDLDAEIQAYVPYFPRKKWPITVRQLLGHVAGITHYMNYDLEGHLKEPKNTREALAIFQEAELVAEPGTVFNYTTYGYNLLGAAVESASGESFGDYVRRRIFEPLGMDDSRLDNPKVLIPNRVRGYTLANRRILNSEFVDVSSRFAGGGLRSTVIDLIKYGRAIIEGGLLREGTRRLMATPMALRNGFLTGYGMGWMVQPWNGHFTLSHSGAQPETRTFLILFPKDELVMALAANLETVDLMPYARRLAELILNEDVTPAAYGPDRVSRAILSGLLQAYSYGLSHFDWNGAPMTLNKNDLRRAFGFFNRTLSRKALNADFTGVKEKIATGIHAASNQAFIRVGSYIAASLSQTGGRERLESCRSRGPLAFFQDYARLSEDPKTKKKGLRLEPELRGLIGDWEKDWASAATIDIRSFTLTPSTDFSSLEEMLSERFRGAAVYPDFSPDLISLAQAFEESNMLAKAFQVLETGRKLYPDSPGLLVAQAEAHLLAGQIEPGRSLFRQAFSLDSTDPGVAPPEMGGAGSILRALRTPDFRYVYGGQACREARRQGAVDEGIAGHGRA